MAAIWNGNYTRIDGSVVEGPSIRDYAAAKAPEAAARADDAFEATRRQDAGAEGHRRQRQDGLRPDDRRRQCGGQQDRPGRGRRLVAQARAVEGVVSALGLTIELEGSDSLDNPSAVIQ